MSNVLVYIIWGVAEARLKDGNNVMLELDSIPSFVPTCCFVLMACLQDMSLLDGLALTVVFKYRCSRCIFWIQLKLLLHWCSKRDVFPIMLNNVTWDLQRNWVTLIKEHGCLMRWIWWFLSASGFQSLPTNIGTETFLGLSHTSTDTCHTHFLPQFIRPPLPLSVYSHTNAQ